MNNGNPSAMRTIQSDDPVWYFLTEFPLSDLMWDQDRKDELTAKLPLQTVRDLGIPPEWVENIEMALKGFIQETRVQVDQRRFGSPGNIRIFCQKKQIGDVSPTKSPVPDSSEHAFEPAQIFHHSGTKMHGGWGYFLVEKTGDSSAGTSGYPTYFVDLYLYKEGE